MSYLIVGSSSGLGRELAYAFAKNKKNLFLVSRDKRDLLPIKSDIEQKFDSKVEILELDFTSIKEIEQKLLSKKEITDDLQGALFPIGLMFEEDDINLNIENATKLINANYLSIGFTISHLKKKYIDKDFLIVGFGSVSGLIGRNLNNFYAAAKRALETHFESLAFENLNNNLKIHFYTLGYLDTNLAFGKKLGLPKGNIKILAELVYANKDKKIIKKHFPIFWGLISLIFKIIPFQIILKLKKFLNN